MLNIQNINIDKAIVDVIKNSHDELKGLVTEQTCLIWSSVIYDGLKRKHLPVQMLSTEDIPNAYVHYFNIVPYEGDYYVIDLTFRQFNNEEFPDLNIFGYQLLNKKEQIEYLRIVSQKKNLMSSFDDLLFKTSNKTIN